MEEMHMDGVRMPAAAAALLAACGPAGRAELNRAAAHEAGELTREHIVRTAPSRHRWADKLGARPTGHYASAQSSVEAGGDASGAWVSAACPGLSRAFGPLTVRPSSARALTIPDSAAAYGRRAEELEARGWRIFRPGKSRVLMGAPPGGGGPVRLYVLARSAKIPQDRGLLPSDAELAEAAARGMARRVREAERRAGGAG